MGSGAPCPPDEADAYHVALVRVLSARTLEEAKDIVHSTLWHWRDKPRVRDLDEMSGLKP